MTILARDLIDNTADTMLALYAAASPEPITLFDPITAVQDRAKLYAGIHSIENTIGSLIDDYRELVSVVRSQSPIDPDDLSQLNEIDRQLREAHQLHAVCLLPIYMGAFDHADEHNFAC